MAVRLRALGLQLQAVDLESNGFKANVPFVQLDLNEPDFAAQIGEGEFDLVTAVEVTTFSHVNISNAPSSKSWSITFTHQGVTSRHAPLCLGVSLFGTLTHRR